MDIQSDLSIIIPNRKEELMPVVRYWCKTYFPKAEVIVEDDKHCVGKGYTVRNGFKKSTKKWIIFLDGDMDIFPSEIYKLLYCLNHSFLSIKKKYDIIVGKKEMSTIPLSRWVIKKLFRIPVSDTQTGLKLFRRECLPEWFTDGYLFDIEILYKAHRKGYRIVEVPINASITKKKSIWTLVKTLGELIILWSRLSFQRMMGQI